MRSLRRLAPVLRAPLPWALLFVLCCVAGVGCGDGDGARDPEPDASDVCALDCDDADAPGPDVEEDVAGDADAEEATDLVPDVRPPPLTQWELSAGDLRLAIESPPFRLRLYREGVLVAESRSGDDPAWAGVALGVTPTYRRQTFYDPMLPAQGGRGDRIQWYGVTTFGVIAEGEESALRFATEDSAGEAGPPLVLRVRPALRGIEVEVEAPDEDVNVFLSLTMAMDEDEAVFGLGEQFDRANNRGLLRDMMIRGEGNSESGTNEVHVPVPFTISTRGYGLFADDRHPAAVDVGSRVEDALRFTFHARRVPFVFLSSADPLEMVRHYSDLTARPAPVPFWALAPQWWRNRNRDAEEVLSDAERARALDMPSTMMWIDRPWQTYYQNFRFNPNQFPDAEGMIERLHALGFRMMLHHSPQINVPGTSSIQGGEDASEGLYERFAERGWFVTQGWDGRPFIFPWGGGRGAFVDWSHPDAVAEVQTMLRRVADLGVVGVKMDWDEYLQPNIGANRIDLRFHNGETSLTMKSWYSALYHKAMYEGFSEALGEPSYNIVRHGSPRDQQWSVCVWPGDLDNDFSPHTRGPSDFQEAWNVGGMPAAIVAQISLGMSGFPCFNSDIGGYRNGQPNEEVLLRWMGFGVFNGVMQIGGGGRTHMPWSADSPYSEEAVEITRRFMRLRMNLFPYVYEAMEEAHRSGHPLAYPLWFGDPGTLEAVDVDDVYFFGEDLVVAPVVGHGVTERDVLLPQGRWLSWWEPRFLEGRQTHRVPAPLDQIPFFVRAGAFVPMAAWDIDTLHPAEVPEVRAYRDRTWGQLFVSPGGEAGMERSWRIGLRVRWAESSAEVLAVDVALGEPDAAVDPRIRVRWESLVFVLPRVDLLAEGAESSIAWVPEGGAPIVLEEGDVMVCDACWATSSSPPRVLVRTQGDGRLVVEGRAR